MKRWPMIIVALMMLLPAALSAAPTAILVDTSRSVPPKQFEETKEILAGLVPGLLEKGPVAVYAFNDKPVRVVDFSSDAAVIQTGISGLEQGGRYTLLYDCAFAAVKDLEERKEAGVILLVTDGKDENSAVTLEDAASRATESRVAVATLGLGASDEKVLRRIAALTGGQYAGTLPGAGLADVRRAWQESEAALKPIAPPVAPRPPASPESRPAAPPPKAGGNAMWLLVLLLLAGFAVVVVGLVILLKRTKPPGERVCEKCGHQLTVWELECPVCLAQKLAITKPGMESDTPAAEAVPELDPALMQKGPSSESLEHTLVLDEVPVLVLQRGKGPPRMFQLPPDQVVSVGRDKINTLSVADQTLSGQHFRIVPKDGAYYLVDLKSTNGTFLDGERVTLKELKPGSVIHAGQCDFAFKREQKKLN